MRRNAPAIIPGDPRGILQLPPPPLKNPADWTQNDSDTLAHFIQVSTQLSTSSWAKAEVKCTSQGRTVLEHRFPELEPFVYAAVYFRQLIAHKDRLMERAMQIYCRHVDGAVQLAWMHHQGKDFRRALEDRAAPLSNCSVQELFEAFVYGAGLMHRFNTDCEKKRRFLKIYDEQPRHVVLTALNFSLHRLLGVASSANWVIYRHFSDWQRKYGLPLPDVRWHECPT